VKILRYWFHPLKKKSWEIEKRSLNPMLGLDKYRKTMRDEIDDRVVFYLASRVSMIVGIYSVTYNEIKNRQKKHL